VDQRLQLRGGRQPELDVAALDLLVPAEQELKIVLAPDVALAANGGRQVLLERSLVVAGQPP
jgi:hypothetical protein